MRRRLSRRRKVAMLLRAAATSSKLMVRRQFAEEGLTISGKLAVERRLSGGRKVAACKFRPSFRLPELRNHELGRDKGNRELIQKETRWLWDKD